MLSAAHGCLGDSLDSLLSFYSSLSVGDSSLPAGDSSLPVCDCMNAKRGVGSREHGT